MADASAGTRTRRDSEEYVLRSTLVRCPRGQHSFASCVPTPICGKQTGQTEQDPSFSAGAVGQSDMTSCHS